MFSDLQRVNGGGGGFLVGGGGTITRTITTAAQTIATTATTTTVLINTAQPTGTVVTGPNGGTLSTRELVPRIGPDPDDPGAAYGTELWAQWAGWVVLGSVIPSIIAFMVSSHFRTG